MTAPRAGAAHLPMAAPDAPATWTFLSNHAHVLVCIHGDPDARIRDIAQQVGVTERAAQGLVSDLVDEGYLVRERVGRRNRYAINADERLRHPLEDEHTIGELLRLVSGPKKPESRKIK